MTEEEAINDLTSMVTGEAEEIKEPITEEVPKQEETLKQEPEVKIDVAKIIAEQNKMMSEQSKKIDDLTSKVEEKDKGEPSEEDLAIEEARQKLGIDMQQQQKMTEFMKQQEEMQSFNQQVAEFEKEHPDVDLKDMGEWADKNNLGYMLNSGDINQWKVVANAMKAVSKVTKQPDVITPTAPKGAETTIWERQEKGEKVDDIELGVDLLRGVGGWK